MDTKAIAEKLDALNTEIEKLRSHLTYLVGKRDALAEVVKDEATNNDSVKGNIAPMINQQSI